MTEMMSKQISHCRGLAAVGKVQDVDVSIKVSGECMLLSSVSSQQRFGGTDIKALGASQLSGLGQTVL